MRFIIELDGPIFDIAGAYYAAFSLAVADVGWSKMDQVTYWRLTRTKGREADLLPAARELKVKQFYERFAVHVESDEIVNQFALQENVSSVLRSLAAHGPIIGVTLATNLTCRQLLLEQSKVAGLFRDVVPINADPRRRGAELTALADGDKRSLVAASSDELVRAADSAELFCVGLTCGACSKPRLNRAGPALVYRALGEIAASLGSGAVDLVEAGLLPATLDA